MRCSGPGPQAHRAGRLVRTPSSVGYPCGEIGQWKASNETEAGPLAAASMANN